MEETQKGMTKERTYQALFEEIEAILLQSERPSLGVETLRKRGALAPLPQLLLLEGVPQNPMWHPEGDVWVHTMMVIDEAVKERMGDPYWDRVLLWAALCHDLGKPSCTVFDEQKGRWRSPGHDLAGLLPTKKLLSAFTHEERFIQDVCVLVQDHLTPHFFADHRASKASIRRLLKRLGSVPIHILVKLGRADMFGRTTEQARKRSYPSGDWLLDRAKELLLENSEETPSPIISGKDLLAAGYRPNAEFGVVLEALYEAQLRGEFSDVPSGLLWLKQQKEVDSAGKNRLKREA